MFQKIKNKIQNFSLKFKDFNEIYINYILCITFLNLIIIKLNQILFEIPSIYLYPIIFFISILFIKQWFIVTDKIKNTYLFNWFLYYFLIFKNNIYGFIFEYFNYVEHEKYEKIIVFLTGFILSSWFLNIFFLILNNSYNLSILLFILLLIINILNLIEKKLIFTQKNIDENNQNIDYNLIKNILKINNQKFNKNKSMSYIQKRYMHFNEIKGLIKRHGVTVITSATAGSLFTGYLQHSSVKIQKEQFEFQKDLELKKLNQNEIKLEQNKIKLEQDKIKLEQDKTILEQHIIKQRDKRLANYDEKIGNLNKEIHKIQVDMDSRHFWNKVDFSESIKNLKEEKKLLKKRRSSFDLEEMKDEKIFFLKKN